MNETGPQKIDNAADQLENVLNQSSDRLAALVRINTSVVSSDEMEKVLMIIGFEIARFMSFDYIAVSAVERAKGMFRHTAARVTGETVEGAEPSPACLIKYSRNLSGTACDYIAATREPVIRPTLEPGSGRFPEEQELAKEGMRSCVMLPMVGHEDVVGIFTIAGKTPHEYSRDDLNFLELIAEELAAAVERQRHVSLLKKRHGKLEIINEISRKAMAQFDMIDVLDSIAASINHYFGYSEVNLFLVDDSAGDVVMMAQSGENLEEFSSVGYRQKLGIGMVGICAATGETLLANDVSRESRRIIAFPGEAAMGSELCVPIKASGIVTEVGLPPEQHLGREAVMGVINVESTQIGAFDAEDVNALESLGAQIAQTIENARLYEETRLLKEFNESIIVNMPSALAVVDIDLRVQIVNDALGRLRGKKKEELVRKDISELFTPWFLREGGLAEAIRAAMDSGKSKSIFNVKGVVLPAIDKLFNVYVAPIGMTIQQSAMVMLEDVTQSVEHAYHLSMLRQVNETVQTTLDLKRLLRLVLTCITSGHALGFNRGILMMVNKNTHMLEGRVAIGPQSQADAYRIWQSIDAEKKSFRELLRDADDGRPDEEMPLYHLAAQIRLPLDSDELVCRVVREKGVAAVTDAAHDERISEEFRNIVGSNSFLIVPLIAKDEAVGAIIADNLYSAQPITPERVELLTIFANHAGLAIENAEAYDTLHKQIAKLQEAYRELRETQGKLVQSEKLAAIGEVAAHVAHEIRNPLVTIGGFARSVRRQLGSDSQSVRSIEIIIEEVARLEKILANVMDFSKPSAPWKRPTKINQIIDSTCDLLSEAAAARNVKIEQVLEPNIPLAMVDGEQIKQALLNILKNAIESIENEGRVTVVSKLRGNSIWIEVTDTGKGVPEEMIQNLFDPFFTTKPDGTGLGLAVTKKIIIDHGGDIDVRSKLGLGTTFTVQLPLDVTGHRKLSPFDSVSGQGETPFSQ